MKKVTLCVMIVFLHALPGWALDISEFNGNDCRQWNKTVRTFYLSGFMTASRYVAEHHVASLEEYDNDKAFNLYLKVSSLKKNEKITLSKEETILLENRELFEVGQSLRAHDLGGIVVGQLQDGLDTLYEDFKNRNIQLSDAVYIVKKQIQGTPKEDIEKILLFFRSGKHIGPVDQTDVEALAQAVVDGKLAPSAGRRGHCRQRSERKVCENHYVSLMYVIDRSQFLKFEIQTIFL